MAAIHQQRPGACAIIMSSYQSEEDMYWAHTGALGYVLKDSSLENFVQCIFTVDAGRMRLPASVAVAILPMKN